MNYIKDISKIRKLNNTCADCNSVNPSWASVNIGILICLRCCVFHRGLGVHISRVKSTTLDNWNSKHITTLKQNGNIKINKIYEAKLKKNLKPNSKTSEIELNEFIINKYDKKFYYSKSVERKLFQEKEKIYRQTKRKHFSDKNKNKTITKTNIPNTSNTPNDNKNKIEDLIDFDSLVISNKTKSQDNENFWTTFDDSKDILNDSKDILNDLKNIFYDKNPEEENKQSNEYDNSKQNTYELNYNNQGEIQPNLYRQNPYTVQQYQNINPYTVQQYQNINPQYTYPSTLNTNNQNINPQYTYPSTLNTNNQNMNSQYTYPSTLNTNNQNMNSQYTYPSTLNTNNQNTHSNISNLSRQNQNISSQFVYPSTTSNQNNKFDNENL